MTISKENFRNSADEIINLCKKDTECRQLFISKLLDSNQYKEEVVAKLDLFAYFFKSNLEYQNQLLKLKKAIEESNINEAFGTYHKMDKKLLEKLPDQIFIWMRLHREISRTLS